MKPVLKTLAEAYATLRKAKECPSRDVDHFVSAGMDLVRDAYNMLQEETEEAATDTDLGGDE